MKYNFYNEDCITGAPKYIDDNSVDLIITDPPYGIKGDKLDKHYKLIKRIERVLFNN